MEPNLTITEFRTYSPRASRSKKRQVPEEEEEEEEESLDNSENIDTNTPKWPRREEPEVEDPYLNPQ